MSRIILALSLSAIALTSMTPAFAANNASNCAKVGSSLAKCVIQQSQGQQN